MNEYNKISSELDWICCNKSKSNNISFVNYGIKRIHEQKIGDSIKEYIKRKNYNIVFEHLYNQNNYFIEFNDLAILHFEYAFDKKRIIFSRLSYIPWINIDEDEEETNDDGDEDEYFRDDKENVQYSKYIRIDYKPKDHEEIIHTKCHIHIGIDNSNFRIPVSTIIYPKEFVYFILKYIYHEDSEFTNLIKLKNEKEILLTKNELNKLRLMIG